jgi:hypothetical protein
MGIGVTILKKSEFEWECTLIFFFLLLILLFVFLIVLLFLLIFSELLVGDFSVVEQVNEDVPFFVWKRSEGMEALPNLITPLRIRTSLARSQ